MEELLTKLTALHQSQGGSSLKLRPGATEEEVAQAEKTMDLKFPADFREYLLLHNGQQEDETTQQWLFGRLDEILNQWRDDRAQEVTYPETNTDFILDDQVQNRQRSPKWIAFLGAPYWDQDIVYIDLAPGPKGKMGQIIALVSESDFEVVAPSFTAFLQQWIKNGKPY